MEVDSEVASKTSSLDFEEDGKPCQSPCKTIRFQSDHKVDMHELKMKFSHLICFNQNGGLVTFEVKMKVTNDFHFIS
jgi:hypothetical protein